jgi:hypothetical protein
MLIQFVSHNVKVDNTNDTWTWNTLDGKGFSAVVGSPPATGTLIQYTGGGLFRDNPKDPVYTMSVDDSVVRPTERHDDDDEDEDKSHRRDKETARPS